MVTQIERNLDKNIMPSENGKSGLFQHSSVAFRPELEESVEIPIFKMCPLPEFEKGIDYFKTLSFMRLVVGQGRERGLEMFVDGQGEIERFHRYATKAPAIEMICQGPKETSLDVWNEKVGGTKAARSVRYRRHLTQELELKYALSRLNDNGNLNLSIASIAAGTGRPTIELINWLSQKYPGRIKGVLIDNDPGAVAEGRRFLTSFNFNGHVKFIEATYPRIRRNCGQASVDIVEAVGIGDYLDENKVLRLFTTARKLLSEDGIFIYTNILPTPEKHYLDIVWSDGMYYRTCQELVLLANTSGFTSRKTVVILDPSETMQTMVARL